MTVHHRTGRAGVHHFFSLLGFLYTVYKDQRTLFEKKKKKNMKENKAPHRGLYPTVAISDTFNAAGNLAAAWTCYACGHRAASYGFLTVGIAATVGVLRFGFSERAFAKANGDLADAAAFVGLPLVGLDFATRAVAGDDGIAAASGDDTARAFLVLLLALSLARSLSPAAFENAKVVLNVACLVGPVFLHAYRSGDWQAAAAIGIFAFAGIVITADRHRCILGVRCENWFHYFLGSSLYWLALRLCA